MNNTAQCTYTKFQEWLADCPTQIDIKAEVKV